MEIKDHEKAKIITLIEKIDSLTSREIDQAFQGLLATGARNIVCNCERTKYISSAGLRVFLLVAKALKKSGGQLCVVCPKTSYAYEVLETAGFTNILSVCETETAALQQLS